MSQTPDEIRADIEATRASLAVDVDELNEKVNPARVVERKVEGAKETVSSVTSSVKEKVMGAAGSAHGAGSSATGAVSDRAGAAASGVSSAASSVGGAVQSAPTVAKQKAAGNPLLAGALAFGVGYLLSTLLPASQKEQAAAEAVKDKALELKEPAKEQLTSVASEVKETLAPAAQEAVATVKDTATSAAQSVKETATDATSTVTDQAKQSGQTVQSQAADSASTVKDTATSGGDQGSSSLPPAPVVDDVYPAATPVADTRTTSSGLPPL